MREKKGKNEKTRKRDEKWMQMEHIFFCFLLPQVLRLKNSSTAHKVRSGTRSVFCMQKGSGMRENKQKKERRKKKEKERREEKTRKKKGRKKKEKEHLPPKDLAESIAFCPT